MAEPIATISKNTQGYCVRLEKKLNFSAETVWNAITQVKHLAVWFTDFEMDFKEGGAMTIWFRDAEKTKSSGKIIRIEKPRLFEWSWEDELATWEIIPAGSTACTLVLTYSKLPASYAVSVPAGWHILLNQLETVLQGRTEPYPFGNAEETPEAKERKAYYAEIMYNQFPELKPNV